MDIGDTFHFAAILGIFVIAGAVKGVLGMGLPTVAMGLLGLILPVPHAASLITVPSFATNVWQMLRGPHARTLALRLAPMMAGILAGAAFGREFMAAAGPLARALLGLILIAYALLGFTGAKLPAPGPRAERYTSAIAGLATGLLTAATGVFVVPAVPYLNSLRLDKAQLSQAMGLSFTVSTLALAFDLSSANHMDMPMMMSSALMLLPALLGLWIGQQIQDALDERGFRRAFFAGMLALGATLLV